MPIDREDGRHWCNPSAEEPDEDGRWTCPGCGTVWLFTTDVGYPLWETPDQRRDRAVFEAEVLKLAALAELDEG